VNEGIYWRGYGKMDLQVIFASYWGRCVVVTTPLCLAHPPPR